MSDLTCIKIAHGSCFKRLDEACVGARYDPKYTISREDLEHLAPHVRDLINRTKAACEAAIE